MGGCEWEGKILVVGDGVGGEGEWCVGLGGLFDVVENWDDCVVDGGCEVFGGECVVVVIG